MRDDMLVGHHQPAFGVDHEPRSGRYARREGFVRNTKKEAVIGIPEQRVLRIGRTLQHGDVDHRRRDPLHQRRQRQAG
jgi:hypothetical protein